MTFTDLIRKTTSTPEKDLGILYYYNLKTQEWSSFIEYETNILKEYPIILLHDIHFFECGLDTNGSKLFIIKSAQGFLIVKGEQFRYRTVIGFIYTPDDTKNARIRLRDNPDVDITVNINNDQCQDCNCKNDLLVTGWCQSQPGISQKFISYKELKEDEQ